MGGEAARLARRNHHLLNTLNGLSDAVLHFFAYFLAYCLRFYVFPEPGGYRPFSDYWGLGLLSALLTVFLYFLLRLYAPKRHSRYYNDISIVVRANLIGIMLLGVAIYMQRFVDFSRGMLAAYAVLVTGFVVAKHLAIRVFLQHVRRQSRNLRHVLLIGDGVLAARYCQNIAQNRHLGYDIIGYVGLPGGAPHQNMQQLKRLGDVDALDDILAMVTCDEAIIALDEEAARHTRAAIEPCNRNGQRFSIIPYFSQYVFSAAAPTVENIGQSQIYDICASPLDYPLNRLLKRAVDIVVASLILLITSPVLLLTAIGVKLSSRGPVLFRQQRVGRKKSVFEMYKFRSMRASGSEDTAWSAKGDARVTAFGRFIRKTSIDELPQMFNVLRGDMSLVGPRPEIPYHVSHFKDEIPYYMARHQVRPGVTGYAQINGYRGDTSIEERINHDLYYIYNWSLVLDLEIIFRTAFGGMMEK